jgi:UDP-N-acetylmuramyl tripeptide synthase
MDYLIVPPIIFFSKLLTKILKILGLGSGTALPGLIISTLYPTLLEKLISQVPEVILITGTNGKTTSQHIIRSILDSDNGVRVLTNSAGANIERGVLSQLMKSATWSGRLDYTHAVFEIEEATMPKIVNRMNPDIIAVTNIYRDQLDAYGEVDITQKYISEAVGKVPECRLVLNGNDPRVYDIGVNAENEVFWYSIPVEHAANFPYEGELMDQGEFPRIKAKSIELNDDLTTTFKVETEGTQLELDQLTLKSAGKFHIYNLLLAIWVTKLLNIDEETIEKGIGNFTPAYGRGETVRVERGNKEVDFILLLVKNPAGLTLNLDLLKQVERTQLIIALNDKVADGKDVSWIWDAKFNILNEIDTERIMLTGTRAADLAVRVKYAVPKDLYKERVELVDTDYKRVIETAFDQAEKGSKVFLLPTYTAMLEIRKYLGLEIE